ncbi:MAG: YibE/F family protein [Nocardioides sp.]
MVDSRSRAVLLAVLGVFAVLTVVGVVALWPDSDRVDDLSDSVSFAAPGVTFPRADVVEVQPPCARLEDDTGCGRITVRVQSGDGAGTELTVGVPPDVLEAGLNDGDTVKLIRTPARDGQEAAFNYFGTVRTPPVALLLAIFVVVVLAVARLRGLLALVGLTFSAAVISVFMLPALLGGENGPLVGVVGSAAIMYVVLYTTHGWSLRTSAALAGTLVGIVLTAALGAYAVGSARLTGVTDDGDRVLSTVGGDLSFQGLLTCAIIIAGLGVLNDVTITQASAVWEIRGAAPQLSRRRVFLSGMRIGRDHIASTIYTIVFAYAGTALTVLMLLSLYDRPFLDLLATEEIGQEVVRTLATSIGLVLAVPLTTLIAVATIPPSTSPVTSPA